jgi:hypothetical protein
MAKNTRGPQQEHAPFANRPEILDEEIAKKLA